MFEIFSHPKHCFQLGGVTALLHLNQITTGPQGLSQAKVMSILSICYDIIINYYFKNAIIEAKGKLLPAF